jgi:hypothetical protein
MVNSKIITSIFDISTKEGIAKAERAQSKFYETHNSVTIEAVGCDKIKIVAKN